MADKHPKYIRIQEYICSLLAKEGLKPGDQLPSENELCKRLNMSRNTVRQALANLINEGLIYNEHGKGTFVAAPRDNNQTNNTHPEIGIVLNNLEQLQHPFFSEYIRGIQEEIDLHKCSIHLIFNQETNKGEMDLIREKNVRGLILIADEGVDEYILSLQMKRIPFVWFPSYKSKKNISYIYLDKVLGLSLAVDHLAQLGHQKIGYIAGDPEAKRDYQEKLAGFTYSMEKNNIPINKNWIVDGYYTRDGAENAIHKMFSGKTRPTAVIAANDIMAIAALTTLQKMGRNVPEDVSIIGFDDILDARNIIPTLTTVHVPMARMGREAAKILFELVDKNETTMIHQVNVEPILKIRESTTQYKT
ncbi:MAG: GntR family transcriptional regulator [bacterium]